MTEKNATWTFRTILTLGIMVPLGWLMMSANKSEVKVAQIEVRVAIIAEDISDINKSVSKQQESVTTLAISMARIEAKLE